MEEIHAIHLCEWNMEESDMNELQKELDAVWNLLAGIPVRGDAVDIMAAVRGGLRRAYKLAEPEKTDTGKAEPEKEG